MAQIVGGRLTYTEISDSDSTVTSQTLHNKGKSASARVHAMKAYEEAELQLHSSLTSALEGSDISISRPDRCSPLE